MLMGPEEAAYTIKISGKKIVQSESNPNPKSGRLMISPLKPASGEPQTTMEIFSMEKGTARDWSQLPQDLLEVIASKANDISHYFRFSAVCKSWGCAVKNSVHLHRQLPWFVHLHYSYSGDSVLCTFYDPWNNKVHDLNLELERMTTVRASYHGWFLILTHCYRDHYDLFLFNPITRARIHLPRMFHYPIAFTLITSNSYSDDDCFVLCTLTRSNWCREWECSMCESKKLAFCRPGDREWTMLDVELDFPYAANCKMKTYVCSYEGRVAVCDLKGAKVTLIPSLLQPILGLHLHAGCFLGTPLGDLLLVACNNEWTEVHIFKADLHEPQPQWIEVQNIGDTALFMSTAHCSCVSTTDFPSLNKNHIYHGGCMNFLGYTIAGIGAQTTAMQNIATKVMKELPYPDSELSEWWEEKFWFTPSLY